MKTITFIGPFTDEDMVMLMQTLRLCERKQPDREFGMSVVDLKDTRPLGDMKEFLKKQFPAVKGLPVEIETFNRE